MCGCNPPYAQAENLTLSTTLFPVQPASSFIYVSILLLDAEVEGKRQMLRGVGVAEQVERFPMGSCEACARHEKCLCHESLVRGEVR